VYIVTAIVKKTKTKITYILFNINYIMIQ